MRLSRVLLSIATALVLGAAGVACGAKTTQAVGVPKYQPSEVVSEAPGSTVLKTSDPVTTVHTYYRDFADKEGWQIVSDTSTDRSASLTIKKSGDGSTIAVASSGSDTTISISTYPSP